MRVIVTGGADFRDRELLHTTLDAVPSAITLLLAGDERGAESLALDYAESHDINFKEFYADYEGHGPAGFRLRNQRMIDHGEPDMVIAFAGGRVARDLVRRAQRVGVDVFEVDQRE